MFNRPGGGQRAVATITLLIVTAVVLVASNLGAVLPEPAVGAERSVMVGPTVPVAPMEGDETDAQRAVQIRQQAVTPTPQPPTPTPEPFVSPSNANELGEIPIFMYHAFVFEEANTDEWTITFDQFRAQLDWLHANDFAAVGINTILDRDFDIPAGKRPVILTFDDASPGQFRLQESAGGDYEPNPDTAVGVLEEYRTTHPGFIESAFFAILPFNCFTLDDDPSTCEERLQWLVEHGYEVGNHTRGHQNLSLAGDILIKEEILEPIAWFNERIDGPNNLADVLVLPYGMYPSEAYQVEWLFSGFWHYGEFYVPDLVLEVTGGPARSPFHAEWDTNLTRINTDPASFWYWAELIELGEVDLFVSDGDQVWVTVPGGWEAMLNEGLLVEDGRQMFTHKPELAGS